MASMVAKDHSGISSQMLDVVIEGKGKRNKRKFRADQLLSDPNKSILLPQNECTNSEISTDEFEMVSSHSGGSAYDVSSVVSDSSNSLKLDLGLSCTSGTTMVGSSQLREEITASADEFNDADWSDLTESQLEELILNNLDAIFKSAYKQIISSGYSEEVARKAILRSGLWYGSKDTASNIVENTLTFLRNGQDFTQSKDHCFEDLAQMQKYVLAEMVCLLREVRPFFSTGDAMWCLLICDMNVSHACAVEVDPLGSFVGDAPSNGDSSISQQPKLRTEPCKPNASIVDAHNDPSETSSKQSIPSVDSLQSEVPNATNNPDMNQGTSFVPNGHVEVEENEKSISNTDEKPFNAAEISHNKVAEDKFASSRKLSGLAKRDYILRQKPIHFERHHRAHGSKGASRSSKLSNFGGLVLDKKLKAVADATGINANNSFKNSKALGSDVPQNNVSYNLSPHSEFASVPTFGMESTNAGSLPVVPVNSFPSLPVADTELSLSFPTESISNPMPIVNGIEAATSNGVDISPDKSFGEWVPIDRRDQMIMKLVPRVSELQSQLQEWTEWANQKVMQAARRLGKDKAEMKTLRQEKEELDRLKKEKQTLEENTMKKISEMENALRKAGKQVERANAAVRRLNVENTTLRREMESAKLHAAESSANWQEVSMREKKTLVRLQSWEKQKMLLQEDLAAEKLKLLRLQEKLKQRKDLQDKAKVKWLQEEKTNNELRTQATSFRKEREQIEASGKSEEHTIKLTAENNLMKHSIDIKRLEKEISLLRLKSDSSKIAALRRGIDGSFPTKVSIFKTAPLVSNGSVKRERECVMCLSEEMSIVFLPCAHQVVCTTCNDLHEKQGMKDCPSCRSPIQRRVGVRYV